MGQNKNLPIGIIACLGVTSALVGIAGGLAAYRCRMRKTCREFYENATRHMVQPGLKEGFDPQDMFYVESANTWLFSGYNVKPKTRNVSPLYKVDSKGAVSKLTVELPDGTTYKGHGAAICAAGEHAFLTVKDGFVVMELSSVLDAADGDTVRAFAHVPVELEPAFMNIQNGILYIGEFYHKRFYETPKSHWVECPDGSMNPALMYAYDSSDGSDAVFGFAPQPSRVYSIPGEIQGMCVASDQRIVMSQSWGYGHSELLVFDPGTAIEQDKQNELTPTFRVAGREAPLYHLYLGIQQKNIALPPMSEGIDTHDGQVWISSESASSLYLLGRINDGKYVYSLTV